MKVKRAKKQFKMVSFPYFARKWREITGETTKGRTGILILEREMGYSPEQSAKLFLKTAKSRRY